MSPHLTALGFALSPAIGLLVCVLVHVVVSRTLPTVPRPHAIVGSVLAGLGVMVGMAGALGETRAAGASASEAWGAVAVWILTYAGLAYCYVIGFFNLGESARRIRLLIELHAAGERGMTLDEVLTVYNARMIIEARLARLLSGDQIVVRGGRYILQHQLVLYVAKALVLMKLVVLGARSELEVGRRRA